MAAIRAVETTYDSAWSAGDLEAVVGCLCRDALLVSPRGEVANGIDEIRILLGPFLEGEAAGSSHESELERITFVRDDVAVVDGRVLVRGSALGEHVEHRFTDVLVRDDGRRAISQVRAYGLGAGRSAGSP